MKVIKVCCRRKSRFIGGGAKSESVFVVATLHG